MDRGGTAHQRLRGGPTALTGLALGGVSDPFSVTVGSRARVAALLLSVAVIALTVPAAVALGEPA